MARKTRISAAMTAAAATLVAASASHAAIVTLNATDVAGVTSFNAGTNWSDATAPSAANDYVVANGRALRTPPDSGSITFAGNSLTLGDGATIGQLTIKNVTNTTVTINNLTLNSGIIQNGANAAGVATTVTVAGNGISVGPGTGTFDSGGAGRVIVVTAPITGAGAISTFNSGTTRFDLSSNLNNPLASLTTSGTTFFSGFGGTRVVNLGGAGATLTWGSTQFNPSQFVLGTVTATGTVDFQNGLSLGVTNRTVFVDNGSAPVDAILSGVVASTTGRLVVQGGGGTLQLTNGANSFNGLDIGANGGATAVRVSASGAAGGGTIFVAGTGGSNRLELTGGVTLANSIFQNGKTNTSAPAASILNVSGNNTLTGTVAVQTGGTFSSIQSDAGLLSLTNANAVTTNATGSRNITFRGAGNIEVTGAITNGTGTVGIERADAGVLTLSGNNTYTGPTTLLGGTLAIGAADRIADAGPVAFGGGTLDTNGFSETVGVASMSATSVVDLDAGASQLRFANSASQAWTGTLVINNWSGNPIAGGGTDRLFFGTDATGLTGAQLAQITFVGYLPGQNAILATGEVVPVPEPTTLGLAAAATSLLLVRRRK